MCPRMCLLKHITIVIASNPEGVVISAHPMRHMFVKTHLRAKMSHIKKANLNAEQIKEGRREYIGALKHTERAE